MLKRLNLIREKQHQVQIKREGIAEVFINGYVLSVSPSFVLIHNAENFLLDGYSVIRTSDITNIRSNKYERFSERVYRAEVLANQIGIDFDVALDDWQSVFRSLKKTGLNVIIEHETLENDDFYIGKLVRINKNSVSMLYFDASGKWDEAPVNISYEDITIVRFKERYIEIFSKYLT